MSDKYLFWIMMLLFSLWSRFFYLSFFLILNFLFWHLCYLELGWLVYLLLFLLSNLLFLWFLPLFFSLFLWLLFYLLFYVFRNFFNLLFLFLFYLFFNLFFFSFYFLWLNFFYKTRSNWLFLLRHLWTDTLLIA